MSVIPPAPVFVREKIRRRQLRRSVPKDVLAVKTDPVQEAWRCEILGPLSLHCPLFDAQSEFVKVWIKVGEPHKLKVVC